MATIAQRLAAARRGFEPEAPFTLFPAGLTPPVASSAFDANTAWWAIQLCRTRDWAEGTATRREMVVIPHVSNIVWSGAGALWCEFPACHIAALGCTQWPQLLEIDQWPHRFDRNLNGFPLDGSKPLILAGHGAYATQALRAADLWSRASGQKATVYTFGSTRLGSAALLGLQWKHCFRVVAGMDAAATMPPPRQAQHAGTHVLLLDGRPPLVDPRWWQRVPSLAAQSWWLTELLTIGLQQGYPAASAALYASVLHDHAPARYADLLRSF